MSKAEAKIVSQGRVYSLSEAEDTVAPCNIVNNAVISNISKFLFQYGRKQPYNIGQYIIREGLYDKTVFILLKGEVEVLKKDNHGNNKVIATMSDGGVILGEMSIFLDEPRSTSVRMSKDSLVLEFTGENFLKAVVNIPELSMRILKSLSNKLKNTNDRFVQSEACENGNKRKPQTKATATTDGIRAEPVTVDQQDDTSPTSLNQHESPASPDDPPVLI